MDDKTEKVLDAEALHMAIVHEIANLKRLTDNTVPFAKILNDTCIAVQRVTFRLAYPKERQIGDGED